MALPVAGSETETVESPSAIKTTALIGEFDEWILELHNGAKLLDRDSVIDRVLDLRNRAVAVRDAN